MLMIWQQVIKMGQSCDDCSDHGPASTRETDSTNNTTGGRQISAVDTHRSFSSIIMEWVFCSRQTSEWMISLKERDRGDDDASFDRAADVSVCCCCCCCLALLMICCLCSRTRCRHWDLKWSLTFSWWVATEWDLYWAWRLEDTDDDLMKWGRRAQCVGGLDTSQQSSIPDTGRLERTQREWWATLRYLISYWWTDSDIHSGIIIYCTGIDDGHAMQCNQKGEAGVFVPTDSIESRDLIWSSVCLLNVIVRIFAQPIHCLHLFVPNSWFFYSFHGVHCLVYSVLSWSRWSYCTVVG